MATEKSTDDEQQAALQPDGEHHGDKQSLLVHMVVLQLKLIADGLRDAMLIPVSLIAAIGGLLLRTEDPWLWYREVLLWGRASDHWIDLFDSYRHQADPDFDALLQATRSRVQQDQARNQNQADATTDHDDDAPESR
ncbi:MAG: hypothetical protein KKC01_04625 [Gammaproteobacteria bacterium]|nr:hypothetical protein [Gammaproteobacteria bacterium]